MTPEQIELSKRAVACRGWRWMPGMRTLDAMRVIHDPDRWPDRPCAIREGTWIDTAPPRPLGDDLPDLSDAATVGCLLALVREAWGSLLASMINERANRWAMFFLGGPVVHGPTEAEALVAALEAAP